MKNKLFTTQEACEYLNISRTTLYRYREAKLITYVNLNNGKIRYLKEDLDKFVNSKRI